MYRPSTIQELASQIRDHRGPLLPRGSGSHQALGNAAVADSTVIDTTKLNVVSDYIPSDLTITVGAGITLGALQELLKPNNQWLPWDAPQHHSATIGGLLAAGLSGPLRHSAGTPRDWVLGMHTVTGDGRIIKSGGKVVKNVAGYDMHKLHIGALGTLGVIAEVSFKIAPLPNADQSLSFVCRDLAHAYSLAYELRERPFNPAALLVHVDATGVVTLLARWTGVTAMVARQVAHARQLASTYDDYERRAWEPLLNDPFSTSTRTQVRIGVPAQHMAAVIPLLQRHVGRAAAIQLLPTVGLVRLFGVAADDVVDLRAKLSPYTGYAVVEVGEHPDRWGPAPAGMAIMEQLKRSWDPDDKLNPGRGFIAARARQER